MPTTLDVVMSSSDALAVFVKSETLLRYSVRELVKIGPSTFSTNAEAMYLGYVAGLSLEFSDRLYIDPPNVTFFWVEHAHVSGKIIVDEVEQRSCLTRLSKRMDFATGVNVGRAAAAFYFDGKFLPDMLTDLCRYYDPTADRDKIARALTRNSGQALEYKRNEGIVRIGHATNASLEYVMASPPIPMPGGVQFGWDHDPPIFRTTLRKTFRTKPDADYWRLSNSGNRAVEGKQGKLYSVYDDDQARWVLWLEEWTDYFARPHLCTIEQSK